MDIYDFLRFFKNIKKCALDIITINLNILKIIFYNDWIIKEIMLLYYHNKNVELYGVVSNE